MALVACPYILVVPLSNNRIEIKIYVVFTFGIFIYCAALLASELYEVELGRVESLPHLILCTNATVTFIRQL